MPWANLTFDEYGEAIRDADVLYLLTEPSILGWGVAWRQIGRISIQLGVEGGSKILHGMSRKDMVLLIFQTTNYTDGVSFHGIDARPQDAAFIAPDCHFTIVTKVRVGWAAVAIPIDLLESTFAKHDLHRCLSTRQNAVIGFETEAANRLVAATRRAAAAGETSTQPEAEEDLLLQTLVDLLKQPPPIRPIPNKDTNAVESLMRTALEYIRLRPDEKITIDDLSRELDVNERTLLRGFRQYLKIGVKQYLLMRQINLVRRAIRENCTDDAQVTATLADYGVTEFGRFSVRYKELFGETPSETLQKSRLANVARLQTDPQLAAGRIS